MIHIGLQFIKHNNNEKPEDLDWFDHHSLLFISISKLSNNEHQQTLIVGLG